MSSSASSATRQRPAQGGISHRPAPQPQTPAANVAAALSPAPAHIRNFSIIAHIDHGKSTLSDRLIERCGALSDREMEAQVLDSMDIERERGITIKAQCVTLDYQHAGERYRLNLIDTPGHVDFRYEVSRSLAACEGALLVVDAAQGVEAQSVANCCTAIDQGLEVLPVLNKMDLPQADPQRVAAEIENIIGIDAGDAQLVSAKTGHGVDALLETLVAAIPPPTGDPEAPFRALIVDSWFDNYLGIVSLVRVLDGRLADGDKVLAKSIGRPHTVDEVGVFTPKRQRRRSLGAGEVGYVIAGIKDVRGAPVGDTLATAAQPDVGLVPGFARIRPQVYAGMFPISADDFENFREALARLTLNDASLHYEPETSDALGFGFRCGFLGMLHMEIVQERLEREYGLALITSAPTVVYEVALRDGSVRRVANPSELPDPGRIEEMREPIAKVRILSPQQYVGNVIGLCQERRGVQRGMQFTDGQVSIDYDIPLAEVVLDFLDRLKSVSRGYASLDYAFDRFQAAPMVRLDMLVNGTPVDALAVIVHRSLAERRGRELVRTMKDVIPRQMFDVALQAAIGRQVIARQTVKALRKNVTAKCYGGDVTRKRKLLEKQKQGKKRMKLIGRVEIPQDAFLAALRVDR